jgi:hypothetical protein
LIIKGVVSAPLTIKGRVNKNIIFKDDIRAPIAFQVEVEGKIITKDQEGPAAYQNEA